MLQSSLVLNLNGNSVMIGKLGVGLVFYVELFHFRRADDRL
jgi:hypothetical protein